MNDEARNTLLFVLAVGAALGGPFGVYTAIKSAITKLETTVSLQFATMMAEIKELKDRRDTHSSELGALRTEVATNRAEIGFLKNRVESLERKQSGDRYPALTRRPNDGG
jgi:hypothetical protein